MLETPTHAPDLWPREKRSCWLARDGEPPALYTAVRDADAGLTDGSPSHTCPRPRCPIDFQKYVIAPEVRPLERVAGWGC